MSLNKSVLLIGAGQMAIDYANVLKAMNVPVIVIGRGEESAKNFNMNTNLPIEIGGINKWLENNDDKSHYVIIAVTGTELGEVTRSILAHGFNNILLEKPGGVDYDDIKAVAEMAKSNKANVLIAYNRHYYSSTIKAKEIIEKDNGVTSFTFEFTEWSHKIENLKKDIRLMHGWLLHNSTHVIDMAFFLGGYPKKINCFTTGGLKWHPKGTVFTGSGITENNVLFSYHSNWDAPGRWSVEILTSKHRLIFRPLEKLKIQKKGSIIIKEMKIDENLDIRFKPGLFREVEAFLNDDKRDFTDIFKQVSQLGIYKKILNGVN